MTTPRCKLADGRWSTRSVMEYGGKRSATPLSELAAKGRAGSPLPTADGAPTYSRLNAWAKTQSRLETGAPPCSENRLPPFPLFSPVSGSRKPMKRR